MSTTDLEALYAAPLPADRTGALYNAFSYPTKISAESVALYIACHTEPGDHVLDVFGGSGTTGIAAQLCERPTERMRALAAAHGLQPAWGKRRATVYELSEIGTLLSRVMTSAPDPVEFTAAAKKLVDSAEAAAPNLYRATSPDGSEGVVRQVIWSDVVACSRCGAQTTYADVRVRFEPLRFEDTCTCVCGFKGAPDDWKRVSEDFMDPWTGETTTRRTRTPWRVYGKSASGNWSRPAQDTDALPERESLATSLSDDAPLAKLNWGDLHRTGYHQGMTHLHHLYTARNFRALSAMWELIHKQPEHLREPLRLLILSYNASHSTLMTRVVLKKNSKDFIVTGAQSGVLYVSGLPVEKNVFTGVRRKLATFAGAFEIMHGMEGRVDVVTGSSTNLNIGDESIDYVFTDPPFGAYIPYAEINQINELWLGKTTDTTDEAIISPAQGKDLDAYRTLLTSVFSEVERVMKPDADTTLVFHSSRAAVWQALADSLRNAGLAVTAATILDKKQSSFKQVNGHVAVSGDPLLRVRKRSSDNAGGGTPLTMQELAADTNAAGHAGEPITAKGKQHRFSKIIGKALISQVPITLDANSVYEMKGRS